MRRASPCRKAAEGLARWALLSCLCAATGCADEPTPWEGAEGRRDDWQSRRLQITAPPSASVPAAASLPSASSPNRGDPCDAGFRLSGEPRADVVRLGLICGPTERFRREGDTIEGAIAEGGAFVEVPLRMFAHRCYRLVASADSGVADLDVELRSERDVVLASDDEDAAFTVLHRRGAVCAREAADARAQFRAGKGRGRFAAEVWSRPDDESPLPAAPIDGRGAED